MPLARFWYHVLIIVSLLALLALAWLGDVRPPNTLERIHERGHLNVGVRIGPGVYYETENGPRGFEYELLRRFTDERGLALRVHEYPSLGALAAALENGRIDLVASGIGPTTPRLERFLFTTPLQMVQPVVIYRYGNGQPASVAELLERRIEVIADTYHEQRLRHWQLEHPDLSWEATAEARPEELLYRVQAGEVDVVLTDANKLALNQRFYPELRVAFTMDGRRPLAWMLRNDARSLWRELNAFIETHRADGRLALLEERYYGHLQRFDYVGTRVYLRHITERLPEFRAHFREAAEAHDLDWRLLAAMGYQESLWDPDAVSPTGVRGVMMLTMSTAEQVGVADREDPEESIRGGAAYLASLYPRIPEGIEEPDRTWFALAAYNVGLGHLLDARTITEMRGGDPDRWSDVKENLPLLTQQQWYSQVRYGYARGGEPVQYVENIRQYYELLVRVTDPGLMDGLDPDEDMELPEMPGEGDLGDGTEAAL